MRDRSVLARLLAAALLAGALLGCGLVGIATAAPRWRAPMFLAGSTGTDQQQAVAADGAGDVMAVWARFAGKDESRHIVQADFQAAGKKFQAPVTLSARKVHGDDPEVAFDRFGDAIVVWHEFHGKDTLHAAIRPKGGHFGASVQISKAGVAARNPQIAFDRAGDAFVLWNANDLAGGTRQVVQLTMRPVHGHFGTPVDLSVGNGQVDSPRLAVDGAGDAVALWRQCNNDVFGCDNGGTYIVQAAIRPAGGSFGAPANLSAAGNDAQDPQVAIDKTGGALAVWDRYNGTSQTVESAQRPPGGSFAPTTDLATGASNPEVAMDAGGDAIVGWQKLAGADGEEDIVQMSIRSAGGTFGTPQNLTGVETEDNLALTMNPSGDAVAAWQDCKIGAAPCKRFVIQAATRRPGASFDGPSLISPALQNSFFPGLAINAGGDALAIWMRNRAEVGSVEVDLYRFGS
jgi:hypothetical protein